jgi:hypothetical protein
VETPLRCNYLRIMKFNVIVVPNFGISSACELYLKPSFGCGSLPHNPATCKMLTDWESKSSKDEANAKWIAAYTKECPKCGFISMCSSKFICSSSSSSQRRWLSVYALFELFSRVLLDCALIMICALLTCSVWVLSTTRIMRVTSLLTRLA